MSIDETGDGREASCNLHCVRYPGERKKIKELALENRWTDTLIQGDLG